MKRTLRSPACQFGSRLSPGTEKALEDQVREVGCAKIKEQHITAAPGHDARRANPRTRILDLDPRG
jgi:hypothetical protein